MADLAETVFIVDRDQEAQRMLAAYLERRGRYVIAMRDLDQMELHLRQRVPDLVICDLQAPQIRELVSKLPAHNLIPIIALSIPASAQDVVNALQAGAKDFIIKPFQDFALIEEAINRQMEPVRLYRLNQRYRTELEVANKELQVNLEELRADQRAGRHIQLKLFPERRREMGGLFFDHIIKPSLYLSGDFLDYFRIDERYVVFYLADVSGHGASSAFVTVLLKNLTNRLQRNLRRGSSDDLHHPERFLERVNKELLDTGMGKHLTMFAGLMDTQTRVLRYTLGAHFPMPILKVGDKAEYLAGNGMPVGLFESAQFATYELELPKRFSLVLFSDGILEVINAKGLAEKEEALLEKVAQCDTLVETLESAFGLQDVTELPDDIAILTITEAAVNDVQL